MSRAEGDNGRDAKSGQFTAGNRYGCGYGRPTRRREEDLAAAFRRGCPAKKFEQVVRKLTKLALGGDVVACKALMSYAIGKPPTQLVVESEPVRVAGLRPEDVPAMIADRIFDRVSPEARRALIEKWGETDKG